MSYSVSASDWWANRIEGISRQEKRYFALRLKIKVEELIEKYGYCKLSTEEGTFSTLQDVLNDCSIPVCAIPYNVRMDIHPDKVQVLYNGGRKETVYKQL